MTSILTSVLSSTVGLLWNKARDSTAKRLKDGDITDAKIREIVVRELNDIKTKLDGLSRKDLLSSFSFLEEGVQLLNVSLDKSKDEQESVVNESNDDRDETSSGSPCGATGGESDIVNEALELTNAMRKLKIVSSESESAKERFKDSRKRATDAFCNEALSIQDRIFAAKLRVVSEVLECLDSPDTAAASCLLFLQKLHDLPAVREIFSVYLGGGVKSIINKTERVENVKSVMMVNYILYQFVWKFSSRYCSAFDWPTIQLSDRSFNPICSWEEVSTRKSWGEEFIKPPNELELDESINQRSAVVNSRGEIISCYCNSIKVVSKTGNIKRVFGPFSTSEKDREEGKVTTTKIVGLAVDQENNVYVVVYYTTTSKNSTVEESYAELRMYDEHYVEQTSCRLDFFPTLYGIPQYLSDLMKLAINKSNNIVMSVILPGVVRYTEQVYVFDNTGQLKYKFAEVAKFFRCVSDNNELIMPSAYSGEIEILTEEGETTRTIKLKEGHGSCKYIAFHFVFRKIIVLTRFITMEGASWFLNFYSETGKLESSMLFTKRPRRLDSPVPTSHPSGSFAIVSEKSITYM